MNSSHQIWVGFIFVYQKSLKRTFKTVFWVQNYLLNFCYSVVTSQSFLVVKNLVLYVRIKAFWYTRDIIYQMKNMKYPRNFSNFKSLIRFHIFWKKNIWSVHHKAFNLFTFFVQIFFFLEILLWSLLIRCKGYRNRNFIIDQQIARHFVHFIKYLYQSPFLLCNSNNYPFSYYKNPNQSR